MRKSLIGVMGLAAATLAVGSGSARALEDHPLEVLDLPDFHYTWMTGRSVSRVRPSRPFVARSKYMPHIGAKQRGKYPPNMPLHGPLPFYRDQEAAALPMAA